MDFRPLSCVIERDSGILLVSGTVDEMCVDALRQAIQESTEDFTRDLTIDLEDVDFLPSMGIGVLVVAMRSAHEHGRRLDLVASKSSMAGRVLRICGLAPSAAETHSGL